MTTDKGDFDLDVVIDATGPWARTTASYVGLELPLWHTKAEVFILVPAAGLEYPFPILKYPRFYARKDKDNIFICKAHMTMDLSDTTHAGIWDPDDLPMTGGTDAYFWEFLTGELLEVYPRLLESSIGNEWVGYRGRACRLPSHPGRHTRGGLHAGRRCRRQRRDRGAHDRSRHGPFRHDRGEVLVPGAAPLVAVHGLGQGQGGGAGFQAAALTNSACGFAGAAGQLTGARATEDREK